MNFAPRKLLENNVATPANVAPNTYFISQPTCKYRKTNYAPFLTFSKRTAIKSESYTDALYDPPVVRSKIKYGNSLQFTAPRVTIDIKKDDVPRPEVQRKPLIKKFKPKGNSGRLFQCRVPFSKGVHAPTIPGKKDLNGYNINEDNDIVKIPPHDYDTTLGPAFYNVTSGELCSNTLRYQGCVWSKISGRKSRFLNQNPGPGDYDIKFISCPHHEDDKIKELMRKCCNVPRYTCQLICRSENEGLPGPGYYEVVDIDKIGELKYLSMKPKPFIRTTERFIYKYEKGPGPQHYLVCDCYKHRKDFSLKKDIPFLGEAQRFPIRKAAHTPGPGDYEVTDIKCHRYEGKKASFNNSEIRKMLEITNDYPGPGEYENSKGIRCCPQEPQNENSVFRSRTCRFRRTINKEEPDPASYSITEAFKYNCDKRFHATGKHIPFGTTEQKFIRIYDFAGVEKGTDTPSVGVYNLPVLPTGTARTFPLAPRFSTHVEKSPGPQTYTFHPIVAESMYRVKTTHNTRLMQNVVNRFKRGQHRNSDYASQKKKTYPDDDDDDDDEDI